MCSMYMSVLMVHTSRVAVCTIRMFIGPLRFALIHEALFGIDFLGLYSYLWWELASPLLADRGSCFYFLQFLYGNLKRL